MLSFPDDGYYQLTLIRYELTAQEKQDLESGLNIDLSDNIITTTSIEDSDFGAELSNKILLVQNGDCFTLIETSCSEGNHTDGYSNGSECPAHQEVEIWTFCNGPGGGGDDSSNSSGSDTSGGYDTGGGFDTGGGGSGSGSGTGGSDTDNPNDFGDTCKGCGGDIITSSLPELEDALINTPCNELKKLTQQSTANSPTIPLPNKSTREAILQMPNEVTPNAEAGYAFRNIPAGNYAKYAPPLPNDPNHVRFPKNDPDCYGAIHTHPSDLSQWSQMFSHDDLYMLIETQSSYTGPNTNGDDLFVNIMTVTIGGNNYTYAVKITDINKLTDKLNGLHSNDKLWEEYGEKLFSYYIDSNGNPLTNITDYEKAFLQFVQNEDLGVSLYEMKQNRNNDPIWNKLELNGNNSPNRIPCN